MGERPVAYDTYESAHSAARHFAESAIDCCTSSCAGHGATANGGACAAVVRRRSEKTSRRGEGDSRTRHERSSALASSYLHTRWEFQSPVHTMVTEAKFPEDSFGGGEAEPGFVGHECAWRGRFVGVGGNRDERTG